MKADYGEDILQEAVKLWSITAPSQPFADFFPESKWIEADKKYRYEAGLFNIEEI